MKAQISFGKRLATLLLVVALLLPLAGSTGSVLSSQQSFIIQGNNIDQLVELVEAYGGTVTSRLEIIDGIGATLPAKVVTALMANPAVIAVTPNNSVMLADTVGRHGPNIPSTDYPEVVGANYVWDEGNLGAGVTVAIVDTGLGWHPGLYLDADGRFRGRVLGWVDFVQNKFLPRDPNGHGTHIAGIIANSQKDAAGEYDGVAPNVRLVGVRVLDKDGAGNYERVIQGIQWVINHKDQYNIRVMNLSLVSPAQSPYWADPLDQAVTQAWAAGIVVVTAAGNSGPSPMSIGVPGNNPYAITVGAFSDNYTPLDWNDDYITPFSAAGPTLDAFVKPDVVAPGAHMVSTMMPNAKLNRDYPENKITPFYFSMAGTSQATAVVSGITALMLTENPNLSPDEVKYRVMGTAFLWLDMDTEEALYSMWQQGTGRVNAYDAVMVDVEGTANQGMDIAADLAGDIHYQGYTIFDETTGTFQIEGLGSWAGGYGSWAGGYGSWAGGYGSWAGGLGSWAGGFGSWAGGLGSWAGGYGSWAGGLGSWAGSVPWADSYVAGADFVEDFLAGVGPDASSSTATVEWVDETP